MLLTSGILLSWCGGQLISLMLQRRFSDPDFDQNFVRFLISTLTFQGAALLLVHRFLEWHQLRWRDILLGNGRSVSRVIAIGLGVGLLVVPLTLAMGQLSSHIVRAVQLPAEEQMAVKVIEKAVEPAKRVCFVIAAVLIVPVAEETLFRGIMYPFLKQRIGTWLAAAITSIVFSAIHVNVVIFIPLVFLALVLTWLYERTDSLLAPILTHAVFNATNLLMLLSAPPDLPKWLHG